MEEGFPLKYALRTPLVTYLEISGKCNLKCDHCFIGEQPKKELSGSEWKRIITECAEMGALILGLAGGEPLIRKDFLQILDHAVSVGVSNILIPTNGTVLPENLLTYLRAHKANITFMVSLDSHRREFHDSLRGVKGTFRKVIENIKRILLADQKCGLATMITGENYSDVRGLWEFMESLEIKKWFIERVQPLGRARISQREWELSKENWERTLEFLFEEVYENTTLAFGDALRSMFWMFKNKPWFPGDLIRESPYPKCEAGKTSMTVTATGDVIPCTQWRTPVGSVKEHHLEEIWNESPLYLKLRALRMDNIETCKDCLEKTFCGGGCRGVAYEFGGSIYAPYPYCSKISYEVII